MGDYLKRFEVSEGVGDCRCEATETGLRVTHAPKFTLASSTFLRDREFHPAVTFDPETRRLVIDAENGRVEYELECSLAFLDHLAVVPLRRVVPESRRVGLEP